MAGKIFVTGDCHGEFHKFNKAGFPEQTELDKEDYMIICGDFGGIWNVGWENKNEKYWLNWLNDRPYTTLFCDGNHENYDRLYGYPVKEWHGGRVHEIRPSLLHLMRGEIYDICSKKVFVFGGAQCHDIENGILSTEDPDFKKKKRFLDEFGRYRIDHLTWWKEELPSLEEIENASKHLEENDFTVDYIITHCIFPELQKIITGYTDDNALTDFLQTVEEHVKYKQWFFGHYHEEKSYSELLEETDAGNEKLRLIYDQIQRIV